MASSKISGLLGKISSEISYLSGEKYSFEEVEPRAAELTTSTTDMTAKESGSTEQKYIIAKQWVSSCGKCFSAYENIDVSRTSSEMFWKHQRPLLPVHRVKATQVLKCKRVSTIL